MIRSRIIAAWVLGTLLLSLPVTAAAQQQDGTPLQRLTVLRSRLEGWRKSVTTAANALAAPDKNKKDKKDKSVAPESADAPRVRLKGLEQEINQVLSELNDSRAKLERAERLPDGTVDKLETTANELAPRVDSILKETAGDRANAANQGDKKKKKGGGLFGFLKGDGDKYEDLTGTVAPGRDRELFEEAAKQIRKGNHETGRLLFNTIITTYPDSTFLPMAKLAIADSFYLEGTSSALIQAAAAYQDWLTFFPTHPLSDRVMLKIGECDMRQMGLPDRQITNARRAEQRLKAGLQQFPNSMIRNRFEERLQEVQENLAMHDLGVGNFYYGRYKNQNGGLKGAQSRYREIVQKYPKFSRMDEVLFKLADTYVQEEEPDEAAKYLQRVVRDYPNCDFAERAKEQLTVIGGTVPQPDPARANVPCAESPTMFQTIKAEISGSTPLTVDKSGVLVDKDHSKESRDLLDEVIQRQGDLPTLTTPDAVITPRRQSSAQPPQPTANKPENPALPR